MNYALCSLFSETIAGLLGTILFLLSHGLISSSLFLLIGCLYDKYGTRNIRLLTGICITMPVFSFFFFVYNIANMSFPGFISFNSEFLVLFGVGLTNKLLLFLLLVCIFFTGVYSLWLINRILFGWSLVNYNLFWSDVQKREVYIFVLFLILILICGLFPNILVRVLSYFIVDYFIYLT